MLHRLGKQPHLQEGYGHNQSTVVNASACTAPPVTHVNAPTGSRQGPKMHIRHQMEYTLVHNAICNNGRAGKHPSVTSPFQSIYDVGNETRVKLVHIGTQPPQYISVNPKTQNKVFRFSPKTGGKRDVDTL